MNLYLITSGETSELIKAKSHHMAVAKLLLKYFPTQMTEKNIEYFKHNLIVSSPDQTDDFTSRIDWKFVQDCVETLLEEYPIPVFSVSSDGALKVTRGLGDIEEGKKSFLVDGIGFFGLADAMKTFINAISKGEHVKVTANDFHITFITDCYADKVLMKITPKYYLKEE